MNGRRWVRVLVPVSLAGAALTAACDALLVDPAPGVTELGVTFAVEAAQGGGVASAFDKVDRVWLRFVRPDSVSRDTVVALPTRNGEGRVRLVLDTKERVNALGIFAELRARDRAVFEGHAVVRVEVGTPVSKTITITPIPAGVRAPVQVPAFEALGDTVRLAAALVFATGDTIPGVSPSWSSENPDVVRVTPGGLAIAVGDGETRLVASALGFQDAVTVRVARVPTLVVVLPALTTVKVGATVRLQAGVLDRNRHPIPGRPIAWASSNPAVAAVSADGTVRGRAPGVVTITATSDGLSGTARVRVDPA